MGSVNGTAVGSVEYSLGGVGDGFLTVKYDVWNSLDCSGDATSGSYVVKTECDLQEGRAILLSLLISILLFISCYNILTLSRTMWW